MTKASALLPNGERLDLEISVVPAFANWPDVAQIVVDNWADVGIRARVELRERTLHFAMRDTSELMIEIWNEDTTGFPFSGQPKMDPRSNPGLVFAPLVRQWIKTRRRRGCRTDPRDRPVDGRSLTRPSFPAATVRSNWPKNSSRSGWTTCGRSAPSA